ncbi:MAG: flavin reductase family protein [Actinomycetota bacterium]
MIDPVLKRGLGQMMHGVQVVAARHEDVTRAYTSHWVTQVSFAEPIVMASVSPRHDTFPLIEASGRFTVSVLAGDQVAEGQYFSYPGRKFRYVADEFLVDWAHDDRVDPVVDRAIAWLACDVIETKDLVDHRLFFARVTAGQGNRLRESPLTYSSRLGWRIASEKAREPGRSIRDELLERLRASGVEVDDSDEPSDDL